MASTNSIARGISRALALGAITALSAGALPAQAQQQPAQQQASGEPALQEVVVTGSIIKRTDFETPSPIQVVTAEDMQQTGYSSVIDVLRNLSANGQGTLNQAFNGAFAGGGSGIALRGLTVGGTLTLVDSLRMIPYPLSDDGQRNFVDISSIPFNVIDRIDVLKDGASAAYGSDAVAGVINVVLKKSFTGADLTVEGGSTQHGDGTTEHIAGIAGVGDLASDGYNAYVAVEYRHQDEIQLNNRSGLWTNRNWTPYGGDDTRNGAYDPVIAPFPNILGGYVLNPATNVVDSTTSFLNPSACPNFAAYQANQCLVSTKYQIQPQTGNLNVLGRLTKNLGGDWQFQLTGSDFRSEAEQVGNAAFYNGLNSNTNVAVAAGVLPSLVTTPPVLLPVGAPNNPFSAPAALYAYFPQQLGPSETEFVTTTYRLFGTLTGTAAGWDLNASAGYMYAAMEQKIYGSLSTGGLGTAANSGFNFATATSGEMQSAFSPEARAKDTNTMEVVDLHGARELTQLPGGPLSMAVGAGYYHLYKNSPAAPTIADGELTPGNIAYAIGGQSNYNAYTEFVAPFVRGLEVDAAVRYDHYNQYGSSTTPKFGVKYSPIDVLTLRGTYGKGFRAPNPAESGQSGALFFGAPYVDPILCAGGVANVAGVFPSQCNAAPPGLQVSSPTLQPEKSTNYTVGFILNPLRNTSVSFDYWDIKVNQDIISGTSIFFLSGFTQGAGPPVRGPQQLLPECTANGVGTAPCPTALALTPVGPYAYTPFPYFNATQTHVNGVDMDLLTHFDVGPGRLTAQVNGTYMLHYDFGLAGSTFDLAGTHGPSIISGDTGNPKIRGTASLAWDQGGWNATLSMNYVGRFSVTDPTNGQPDCLSALKGGGTFTSWVSGNPNAYIMSNYCEVAHFTDFDLYSKYAITKKWDVHGSILNLFNTAPPVDLTTYGAAAGVPYNPAMHEPGAIGRFFMLGTTYKW